MEIHFPLPQSMIKCQKKCHDFHEYLKTIFTYRSVESIAVAFYSLYPRYLKPEIFLPTVAQAFQSNNLLKLITIYHFSRSTFRHEKNGLTLLHTFFFFLSPKNSLTGLLQSTNSFSKFFRVSVFSPFSSFHLYTKQGSQVIINYMNVFKNIIFCGLYSSTFESFFRLKYEEMRVTNAYKFYSSSFFQKLYIYSCTY